MRPYTERNKMLKFHLFRTLPITLPNKKGQAIKYALKQREMQHRTKRSVHKPRLTKKEKKNNKSQTRLSYFIGEINDGSKNQEMFKSNYTYISTML